MRSSSLQALPISKKLSQLPPPIPHTVLHSRRKEWGLQAPGFKSELGWASRLMCPSQCKLYSSTPKPNTRARTHTRGTPTSHHTPNYTHTPNVNIHSHTQYTRPCRKQILKHACREHTRTPNIESTPNPTHPVHTRTLNHTLKLLSPNISACHEHTTPPKLKLKLIQPNYRHTGARALEECA